MTSATYDAYLQSAQWQAWREWIKERDGHVCQDCGTRYRLHVHHLTYERLGHEWHTDLITVCDVCHDMRHAQWWVRVPGGADNGRDFTFDYLGPQTEWRLHHWPIHARPNDAELTYQEQAWHADRWHQRAYAEALVRAARRPRPEPRDPFRPVRNAGRFPNYVPAARRAPHPVQVRSRKRRGVFYKLVYWVIWMGVAFLAASVLVAAFTSG